MMEENNHKWFDPRINSAFLFGLFLQAITAFIWVGAASQRLQSLESRFDAQAPLNERMARLEAEMSGARQSLSRIENRLDNEVKK
ncbi:MAG: hypothetical protein LCH83_06390 [Proteobacteria bacterium]|nr:hypothetical protein [Pseudomonadota bacterium]